MTQGPVKNISAPRNGTITHVVSVPAVAQLGLAQGQPKPPIYQTQGFSAPVCTTTVHPKGSQK